MSGYGEVPADSWRNEGAQGQPGQSGQPPGDPSGAPGQQYPAAPQYPNAPAYGYGPGGPDQQAQRLPMPPSVHWASILMIVRVVLSVIGTVFLFTQIDQLIDDAVAKADPGTTVDRDAVHTALIIGGVFALIISALLLWLALLVRQGKNWARIVALVLAGLSILGALASFRQASDGVITTLNVLGLVSAIAVFVLLLLPSSNAYFKSFKAPQY
jgi:Family of unknown function (DUF6264)